MARYPTVEHLLEEAVAESGPSDFGPGDFREGLEVLLDSLERDGDLHPDADASVIGDFRRRLVNRLAVEAWYTEHPEVEDIAVRGPVDVNGLPRTGTTALRRHAVARSSIPLPARVGADQASSPAHARRRGGRPSAPRLQKMRAARSDEQRAMHIFEVDATMEDTEVLGMAFHGQQMMLPVRSYRDWWRDADLTDTYAYHRRVVKLLGSQRPPNLWLFKAPHHKFHLEALTTAYPDIRFVMTHRDPGKVVPSYASIVLSVTPPAENERDLAALGQEICEHLRIGMEHAIEERARIGEDRFLDVNHRDLVADPKGTIQRIYEWLDLDLTIEVEQTILDWQAANRMGAQGTHRHTAEQYGLTTNQIRSDYDFYIRRFDVAVEG
jgi:hypothetical protein